MKGRCWVGREAERGQVDERKSLEVGNGGLSRRSAVVRSSCLVLGVGGRRGRGREEGRN